VPWQVHAPLGNYILLESRLFCALVGENIPFDDIGDFIAANSSAWNFGELYVHFDAPLFSWCRRKLYSFSTSAVCLHTRQRFSTRFSNNNPKAVPSQNFAQFYCLELMVHNMFLLDDSIILCNILFCSRVRTRKHVQWYWCGLCDHCFSHVFSKRKASPLDQRVVQTKTTIHTRKSHDILNVEGYPRVSPKRLQNYFFVLFSGSLFDVILKTVTLQSLKGC